MAGSACSVGERVAVPLTALAGLPVFALAPSCVFLKGNVEQLELEGALDSQQDPTPWLHIRVEQVSDAETPMTARVKLTDAIPQSQQTPTEPGPVMAMLAEGSFIPGILLSINSDLCTVQTHMGEQETVELANTQTLSFQDYATASALRFEVIHERGSPQKQPKTASDSSKQSVSPASSRQSGGSAQQSPSTPSRSTHKQTQRIKSFTRAQLEQQKAERAESVKKEHHEHQVLVDLERRMCSDGVRRRARIQQQEDLELKRRNEATVQSQGRGRARATTFDASAKQREEKQQERFSRCQRSMRQQQKQRESERQRIFTERKQQEEASIERRCQQQREREHQQQTTELRSRLQRERAAIAKMSQTVTRRESHHATQLLHEKQMKQRDLQAARQALERREREHASRALREEQLHQRHTAKVAQLRARQQVVHERQMTEARKQNVATRNARVIAPEQEVPIEGAVTKSSLAVFHHNMPSEKDSLHQTQRRAITLQRLERHQTQRESHEQKQSDILRTKKMQHKERQERLQATRAMEDSKQTKIYQQARLTTQQRLEEATLRNHTDADSRERKYTEAATAALHAQHHQRNMGDFIEQDEQRVWRQARKLEAKRVDAWRKRQDRERREEHQAHVAHRTKQAQALANVVTSGYRYISTDPFLAV
eukprot:m.68697 g.68697  ORF g.68697 m.68697 type:complete len:658 (+) comp12202_c1_seq2:77-2050(+)